MVTGVRALPFLFTPEPAASSQMLLCSCECAAASGNQSVKIKPREIHDDKLEAEKQKHQRFDALLPSNYANFMVISIKSTRARLLHSDLSLHVKTLLFFLFAAMKRLSIQLSQCNSVFTHLVLVCFILSNTEPVMTHLCSINKL